MIIIPPKKAEQQRRERLELAQRQQLSNPLVEKERIFAFKLLELATKFNINLLTLEDINIGSLLTTAQEAGVSETEIANASAILLALAKDVEAESGLNWTDTWLNLKGRLPEYLMEAQEE